MNPLEHRVEVASKYISGNGIEIGALNNRLKLPDCATAKYVDRHDINKLRNEQFPELAGHEICQVDIIDDCETLKTIQNETCDFVIVNHIIEHCRNPLAAIETFLRVLRVGGVIFMTVPDKRFTFDRDRPLTPLEHVVSDYKSTSSSVGTFSHYDEYVRLVDKITEPDKYMKRIAYLLGIDYSIHFHVWNFTTFSEMIDYAKDVLGMKFEIAFCHEDGQFENMFILKKVQ